VLTNKIRVLALDIQSKCNEYGIETWLAPTGEIRVLALAFSLSVRNVGSDHDLRQLLKFVYWHSIFRLSVWIWARKIACANW